MLGVPGVPLTLTHWAQITTAVLETSVIWQTEAHCGTGRTSSDGPCGSVSRRSQHSDASVVLKRGAHVSVGEEVAGGDAADGLMDVHASDLSGSSAIKVQPLLL